MSEKPRLGHASLYTTRLARLSCEAPHIRFLARLVRGSPAEDRAMLETNAAIGSGLVGVGTHYSAGVEHK